MIVGLNLVQWFVLKKCHRKTIIVALEYILFCLEKQELISHRPVRDSYRVIIVPRTSLFTSRRSSSLGRCLTCFVLTSPLIVPTAECFGGPVEHTPRNLVVVGSNHASFFLLLSIFSCFPSPVECP